MKSEPDTSSHFKMIICKARQRNQADLSAQVSRKELCRARICKAAHHARVMASHRISTIQTAPSLKRTAICAVQLIVSITTASLPWSQSLGPTPSRTILSPSKTPKNPQPWHTSLSTARQLSLGWAMLPKVACRCRKPLIMEGWAATFWR